jgi:hypothetical protein
VCYVCVMYVVMCLCACICACAMCLQCYGLSVLVSACVMACLYFYRARAMACACTRRYFIIPIVCKERRRIARLLHVCTRALRCTLRAGPICDAAGGLELGRIERGLVNGDLCLCWLRVAQLAGMGVWKRG